MVLPALPNGVVFLQLTQHGVIMPLPERPQQVIVPVVTMSSVTGTVDDLLGTGFMVAPGVIMSAKHVLGVIPPEDHCLSAASMDGVNGTVPTYEIEDLYLDPKFDIAVGRVREWPDEKHMQIKTDDNLHMNWDVLTVEYSDTQRNVPMPNGRREMKLVPTYHKGYVMREYVAEFGHPRPVGCIDLSYPAFKRASGAPVAGSHLATSSRSKV